MVGLFVCVEAKRPSQQFFSHVGTEPTLLEFNQYCRELLCLAQGQNVTTVGIESRTSRFGVRRFFTTPPRSLKIFVDYMKILIIQRIHSTGIYGVPGPVMQGHAD